MAAWLALKVDEFLTRGITDLSGRLAAHAAERNLSATSQQLNAWFESIELLQTALTALPATDSVRNWGVLLEYDIPRRGRRPDAVILAGQVVFVIEFKCGANSFDLASLTQTAEYAQDLRDFHAETAGRNVVPVLVATRSHASTIERFVAGCIIPVQCIGKHQQLAELFGERTLSESPQLVLHEWDNSRYQPTPDILSAAREVYAGNDVRGISFNYADNLDATVNYIRDVIDQARERAEHVVLFVTGVPGSGKTLAGLSAVHRATEEPDGPSEPLGAYLSGNGPLVDVLRYALAKDKRQRDGISASEAERLAGTFIQPVHLYIRVYNDSSKTPPDHVIVFDEAQRAWDAAQMASKQGIDRSEAEVILDAMSRVRPWSVLVALVGEGQEINRGEAGLKEWAAALVPRTSWCVHTAPELRHHFTLTPNDVVTSTSLHLDVSVRSPRAQGIADWADAVVNGRFTDAADILEQYPEYPIFVTRSLEDMRNFLHTRTRPDRRTGLLVSSQARRLRPFGIEVDPGLQGNINWPRWFVDDADDIRSSTTLEIAATEFKCQGLELDWVGLCWGSDYNYLPAEKTWEARRLRGSSWTVDSDLTFARNRYRVLLTRARYGLVIWIPSPNASELLVNGDRLDSTAAILETSGVKPLSLRADSIDTRSDTLKYNSHCATTFHPDT